MKRALEFAAYPLVAQPRYLRWLLAGVVMLVAAVGAGAALHPLIEARWWALGVAGVGLGWSLLFMARVLRYRFNRHNAQCYAQATERRCEAWWRQHRQCAGLLKAVLVSPACSRPEQVTALLALDNEPLAQAKDDQNRAIRLPQVIASEPGVRECELAVLLALQWRAGLPAAQAIRLLRCFWQGSPAAWQAFRQQVLVCFPEALLPEEAEPWHGLDSLGVVIDHLQQVPADARILCAGSHCSVSDGTPGLPAGEAAVLWLLAPRGPLRLSRGEWYCAQADSLAAVAERAQQQSGLDSPVQACVSFAQGEHLDPTLLGWNLKQRRLDMHFGALGGLQAMVVQTLAAWYASQHGTPCGWLAADPHYTLTLGIAEPDDASK